ncbi:exported hypothetical protein [Candidatus Sulfopaludibacter sp. SbA4]|nr:exported hypothetical protein [Candidatus Sulfopaludibacter sp. SbA4]
MRMGKIRRTEKSKITGIRVPRLVYSFRAASAVCLLLIAWPARAQTISLFAGNGNTTSSGDGGSATAAAINEPSGLAIDPAGDVYISDTNGWRVRRVNPAGIISTVAGNGTYGATGDGGQAINASFSDVFGIALDGAGNLYVADASNRRVRKVTAAGIVTTIAGTGVQGNTGDGGLATNATLNRPIAVALDAAGNLYICDSSNHNVRRVNLTTGLITTYAGNGVPAFAGDGGLATAASLMFPLAVATDKSGNLYVADAGNNCIRRVSSAGVIATVAGNGNLSGFAGDGAAATAALINLPSGVAVDGAGSLFIADSGNNRLRKVDATSGIISTMAGGDGNGSSGDGGPATNSLLDYPWGIAIDSTGALYIADRMNNRIRKISGAAVPPPPPPLPPAPAPSSTPTVTSFTPAAATGTAQTYSLQIGEASGWQDIDVVNVLINRSLDGRQACYLAYSQTNMLYLVNDNGDGLLPGMPLNGSGTLANSQCVVTGAGSSAVGSGNTLTLTLNISFTSALAGDRVVYAAARTLTLNSGWQTMGVLSVPPWPSNFPNGIGTTPSSGSAASATFAFTFGDANTAANLQTAWALFNTALDGRSACYIAYYRPGNQVLLYPDNGDPSKAASMVLAGANTLSNSQCTISAQGSSVAANVSQLTVNLNITFKPAFAGPKAVWMAVQTMGGAQTSQWRPLGAWVVPSN